MCGYRIRSDGPTVRSIKDNELLLLLRTSIFFVIEYVNMYSLSFIHHARRKLNIPESIFYTLSVVQVYGKFVGESRLAYTVFVSLVGYLK